MDKFSEIFTVEYFLYLLKCARLSILMALCAVILGTLLGTLVAAGRISKNKIIRTILTIYVDVIRGTPMMLQLMLFYFGLPAIIPGYNQLSFSNQVLITGIIGMSINSSAYSGELIRSGIQSIDKGQWEAGKTLGLSNKKIMKLIILPQAFKRIIPPLVSEFITLIKDTSLLSSFGAVELLAGAKVIGNHYYSYILPLLMAAIIYLAITSLISFVANKIERKLSIYD